MDDIGNILWIYISLNLRFLYGLEKDLNDNIYIVGKSSNNIYVVLCDGDFFRVFDIIDRLWFIMIFFDDDSVCCICSDNIMMIVYCII